VCNVVFAHQVFDKGTKKKKKKNIDLHAGKEEKINGIKSYKCSGWLL
jgi:hypothetical protein